MINKIRNLKTKDVLLLILISGFFYFMTTTETEGPGDYEELISEHEPLIRQIREDIPNILNDEDGFSEFLSRETLLVNYYGSPSFDRQKLENFQSYLEQSGWQQLPTQDYLDYGSDSIEISDQPVIDSTTILCKNGATVLIWMEDLTGKYDHTSNIGTSIRSIYDFRSPCFNLENENSER